MISSHNVSRSTSNQHSSLLSMTTVGGCEILDLLKRCLTSGRSSCGASMERAMAKARARAKERMPGFAESARCDLLSPINSLYIYIYVCYV